MHLLHWIWVSTLLLSISEHSNKRWLSMQHWTGTRFDRILLKQLGLKFQLNHTSMFCVNPVSCHSEMLVLHTNGIHEVAFEFCGCPKAIPQHIQLLRRGIYPASQITVRTCATFELLKQLHMFALTMKASTYDFYRGLECLTTNTGIKPPKFRLRALMRMVLQWRHLKLLKRGGRAHDLAGVEAMQDGQLAIQCLSCPHPDRNLPEGWESASPKEQ